ncbi:protein kinase [Candidatus Uhrbacteria bacterium]|nr:protein kinase [Candidatus Uhrbacteria bacterium]
MSQDEKPPQAIPLSLCERLRTAAIAFERVLGEAFHVELQPFEIAPDGGEFSVTLRVCPQTEPKRGSLEPVAYKSPEQVRGLPLDRRSDIFSVGAVLYELLAGRPVFDGGDPFTLLQQICGAEIPSLLAVNPNVPMDLGRIVHQALARDPRERYESAAALRDELMRFVPSVDKARGELAHFAQRLADCIREARARIPITPDDPHARGPVPFGSYLLRERIGDDGLAEIFRAETSSPVGTRTCVIHRLYRIGTNHDAHVEALLDAAKIGTMTWHANIVELYDVGRIEDVCYIAHEDVIGVSLAVRLDWSRYLQPPMPTFSIATACSLMAQVCEALEHTHRITDQRRQPLGFVHRDVRPANILISTNGDVKLLTLGITRAIEELPAR